MVLGLSLKEEKESRKSLFRISSVLSPLQPSSFPFDPPHILLLLLVFLFLG